MGHLVGNDVADAAQVLRLVRLHVVQGRLEDTGGEVDAVGGGAVVGVHRIGGHPPLGLVHRLFEVVNGFLLGGIENGHHIAEIGAAVLDALDLRVVQIGVPVVGITHVYRHGV